MLVYKTVHPCENSRLQTILEISGSVFFLFFISLISAIFSLHFSHHWWMSKYPSNHFYMDVEILGNMLTNNFFSFFSWFFSIHLQEQFTELWTYFFYFLVILNMTSTIKDYKNNMLSSFDNTMNDVSDSDFKMFFLPNTA